MQMTFLSEYFNIRKENKAIPKSEPYFYSEKFISTLFETKTFEAFNTVPEVNSVLNYRASAKRNVKITAVNKTTGKPSTSPSARKILTLLDNPNWFQGFSEFVRQSSLWHDITGNEYLYFSNGIGFKPTNAKAIFTLPPQTITVELKADANFYDLDKSNSKIVYKIKLDGKENTLNSEHIIHLNDNRVNVSHSKDVLLGESKLKALAVPINNIIAAYEARNVFLTKRGALGILSNSTRDSMGGTMPLNPEDKDSLQKEFLKYGVMKDQFHTIITNMSLTWTQMGVDLEDLKVFDEVREDFYKIMDAFGVPKDLFSTQKGSTFANQNSAEKRFYESTVIPEFSEWIGALNKFFITWNETWELKGDYTHLPIFQENIKERSSSLQTIVNALSKALEDGAINLSQYQAELSKFGI